MNNIKIKYGVLNTFLKDPYQKDILNLYNSDLKDDCERLEDLILHYNNLFLFAMYRGSRLIGMCVLNLNKEANQADVHRVVVAKYQRHRNVAKSMCYKLKQILPGCVLKGEVDWTNHTSLVVFNKLGALQGSSDDKRVEYILKL